MTEQFHDMSTDRPATLKEVADNLAKIGVQTKATITSDDEITSFVSKAQHMLNQARRVAITAQAQYHEKRHKLEDDMLRLDAEFERNARRIGSIIEKLEALRS